MRVTTGSSGKSRSGTGVLEREDGSDGGREEREETGDMMASSLVEDMVRGDDGRGWLWWWSEGKRNGGLS